VACIVIEIPEECNALVMPLRKLVARVAKTVRQSDNGRARDYAAFEIKVADDGAAIERAAHQAVLQSLDVDAPVVIIEGRLHSQVGRHDAPYHSMAGDVHVMRSIYRPLGEHNGKTVDPVSLRAGVVGDGWLPRTAEAMAHEVARGTSREAVAGCELLGRLPYSRSSFERVAHLVASEVRQRQASIEDALIDALEIPAEVCSVSASFDRVSIPMEEEVPPPKGRPRKNGPRRHVKRVFKMGYCGTVTLHDAQGRAVHTIRYGRMPDTDTFLLGDAVACDVLAILHKRPDLQVVLLADGAKEMWGLLDRHLSPEALGLPKKQVTYLIDFWHVVEKLAKAARVIYGESGAPSQLAEWRRLLLTRRNAVATIAASLHVSGCINKRIDGDRPVHDAITYLDNNGDLMRFVTARRKGLPIGSGNVEATCKSLVAQRMKRSGSRWKEETGEDVLQLRALVLSDRWHPALRLALKPLRRSVRAAQEKEAA
jgi:hypothetical protein